MGNSSPNRRASSSVRPIHINDDSVSSRFGSSNKTNRSVSSNIVSGKLKDFKKGLNRRETENNFLNFLKSDKLISYTSLLKDIEGIRNLNENELKEVVSLFVEKCSDSFDTTNKHQQEFMTLLKAADSSSIAVLLLQVYPDYVALRAGNIAVELSEDSVDSRAQVEVSSKTINSFTEPNNTFLANAMEAIDASELNRLYASGSWLTSLLEAVENLPICVSIATASKSRRGFPLIYVNACFERTTGYNRKEIVGRNCRFLQSEVSEPESLQRLTAALADAKPLKVSITNVRKDGIAFVNFLSMKPIFDDAGEYRYVIGMQFDVTQADATPAKLKLADELMKMLPDEIPSDEPDI